MKTKTATQIALEQEDARRDWMRIQARRDWMRIQGRPSIDLDVYLDLQEASLALPEEDREQYMVACERLMSSSDVEMKVYPTRFSTGFELTGD